MLRNQIPYHWIVSACGWGARIEVGTLAFNLAAHPAIEDSGYLLLLPPSEPVGPFIMSSDPTVASDGPVRGHVRVASR